MPTLQSPAMHAHTTPPIPPELPPVPPPPHGPQRSPDPLPPDIEEPEPMEISPPMSEPPIMPTPIALPRRRLGVRRVCALLRHDLPTELRQAPRQA